MKINLVLINLMLIALCSCTYTNVSEDTEKDYQKAKGFFEKKFVDHFPDKKLRSAKESALLSSRSERKNDFNLILYQYNVDVREIDSVIKSIQNKAIAHYNPSDTCLLVVNRFESIDSKDSSLVPTIKDSTLINRDCYYRKYPIPNFIGFMSNSSESDLKLDSSFTVYVLEAKKVDSWGVEFALEPAPQMPSNWKNGYSKGIALSTKKSTIVYWTVIW